MIEDQWHTCTDPIPMLNFVWETSDRKLQLFAVGCCRRISHLLSDQRSVNAVRVADRYLDGLASYEELNEACEAAQLVFEDAFQPQDVASIAPSLLAIKNLNEAIIRVAEVAAYAAGDQQEEEKLQQAALLRHIIGNPFRPIQFEATWQTETTISLAQHMYNNRDFANMPILADALEDAGCSIPQVLDHCRSEQVHVRGCWVVDLVLGRE